MANLEKLPTEKIKKEFLDYKINNFFSEKLDALKTTTNQLSLLKIEIELKT